MKNVDDLAKTFLSGLSKKEKRLLYATCLILLFFFFDKIIYSPISHQILQIDNKIAAQKELIRKNLSILNHKEKIIAKRKKYKDFFVKKDLAHEERVANFLSEVERLSKASQVTLLDINPVEIEEKNNFSQYQLKIECRAAMPDLLSFIYALDNSNKPIRIAFCELIPQKRSSYIVQAVIVIEKLIIISEWNMN
jgi:hypothetical protein